MAKRFKTFRVSSSFSSTLQKKTVQRMSFGGRWTAGPSLKRRERNIAASPPFWADPPIAPKWRVKRFGPGQWYRTGEERGEKRFYGSSALRAV